MVVWNIKLNKGDYVTLEASSHDIEVNTLEMVLIHCLIAFWKLEYSWITFKVVEMSIFCGQLVEVIKDSEKCAL